jgi:hypothetical protein
MHSADICCSMAISIFPGTDPKSLLDAVHAVTHFGPGGRPRGAQFKPSSATLSAFEQNPYLRDGALSVASSISRRRATAITSPMSER